MADKNILALTINITMVTFAMLGMLTFYIALVNNEGRGEIFDNTDIEEFNLNLTSQYASNIVDVANVNTNLSAAYNPELSISAADQTGNAMALNQQQLTTIFLSSMSIFMGLIFGSIWTTILSGLVLGLITFAFTYYFISVVRSGR